MKRSEINAIIKKMEKLLAEYRFALPDYLSFTPEQWAGIGHDYDEIRHNALGWDVTDYGMGRFAELGLALITLRNGNVHDARYPKPYCEKIIMVDEGQVSPMHYHKQKIEDIINRGGGNIVFTLYPCTDDGGIGQGDIEIYRDGQHFPAPAGSPVILKPGQSLTLMPGSWHGFVIEKGSGVTLVGEVSTCNDDANDNFFADPLGRFPKIEEDEPAYRLLCTEYPAAR